MLGSAAHPLRQYAVFADLADNSGADEVRATAAKP
jgi:hypothetical protein